MRWGVWYRKVPGKGPVGCANLAWGFSRPSEASCWLRVRAVQGEATVARGLPIQNFPSELTLLSWYLCISVSESGV